MIVYVRKSEDDKKRARLSARSFYNSNYILQQPQHILYRIYHGDRKQIPKTRLSYRAPSGRELAPKATEGARVH